MKRGKPYQVTHDVIRAQIRGELPTWYDITKWQAKRVWEALRKMGIDDLGVTPDPSGGYWVRQYDKDKRK
jgi:hypothetical protein